MENKKKETFDVSGGAGISEITTLFILINR